VIIPEHLEAIWQKLKAVMKPGRLNLRTKEIIALAFNATPRGRGVTTRIPRESSCFLCARQASCCRVANRPERARVLT